MATPRVILDACCLGRRKTGNETYIRGLLRGFTELPAGSVELQVLTTPRHTGPRDARFAWRDVPLGNFLTRNFLTIPRQLSASGAQLYHASYWTRYWDDFPKIVTVHDLSFVSFPAGYRAHERMVYCSLIKRAARRARHVLTVSEFSKSELMRHWQIPAERISVTCEGLDDCFCPAPEPRPAGDAPPTILYVGNLHPRKNLVRLLEAFVQLRRETDLEARLKIVGQRAWLTGEIFETVRRHQLESSVEFTGYVSQDELVRCYQQAAVAVYPSLYEGFGFPVLEAMGCGTPVVTSNTTSIPEVAGEAGVLVNPESVGEIAGGIAKVLQSPAFAAKLRGLGLARAREFQWRHCAAATLAAYERALV